MNEIKDQGEAIVTDLDLIKEKHIFSAEQTVLYILQKQGAPIKGILYFEIMDGYDWSMSMEPGTYNRLFTWRKRS